jgi:hypothetical protein
VVEKRPSSSRQTLYLIHFRLPLFVFPDHAAFAFTEKFTLRADDLINVGIDRQRLMRQRLMRQF